MNWLGRRVDSLIGRDDTVLDIGCGLVQPGIFGRRHLGVDGFRPALQTIATKIPTIHGTAPGILEKFVDRSFDVVLLLDVLEHLHKISAMKTVTEAERIARKYVVICTPRGFIPQEGFADGGLPENPLQKHVCGFEETELRELGYKTMLHPNRSIQHGRFTAIVATKAIES